MTPEDHYAAAERLAQRAETTVGASDASLRFALLAIAHALMAQSTLPATNFRPQTEKLPAGKRAL